MTEKENGGETGGERRGADADNEAMLARYGFEDLPAVFAMRDGNGTIIQEKQPCYQCMSDGFYGRGMTGTMYQEGDVMVADFVPNDQMQPLNRAAGIRFCNWKQTLPNNRMPISIEDMAEASQMLAKDPRVKDLDPDSYQKALIDLSTRLKIKRAGKDALELPQLAHNFTPQSGGKAPPILGAKLSDMGQRGPGFTNAQPANATTVGGARKAAAATSALGGTVPLPTQR